MCRMARLPYAARQFHLRTTLAGHLDPFRVFLAKLLQHQPLEVLAVIHQPVEIEQALVDGRSHRLVRPAPSRQIDLPFMFCVFLPLWPLTRVIFRLIIARAYPAKINNKEDEAQQSPSTPNNPFCGAHAHSAPGTVSSSSLRCSLKYCQMVIQGKSRSDFPVAAWSAAAKSTG
jgi:hypothetical protein